jgi:hypothetical protein
MIFVNAGFGREVGDQPVIVASTLTLERRNVGSFELYLIFGFRTRCNQSSR